LYELSEEAEMDSKGKFVLALIALSLAGGALAAPGGNGKGKGGGKGDPPADFIPAIAYMVETNKYEDIRIANVEGDQSCLVLRINKSDPPGQLRAFAVSAATRRLAYSRAGNLYVTTWTDNPCMVASTPTPVVEGQTEFGSDSSIEALDFSPDGQELVWTINPTVQDGSRDLVFYNFDVALPAPVRVSTDHWFVTVRFSPDYADTGNLFFTGREATGAGGMYDLFRYSRTSGNAVRIATGPNFDSTVAVSNPDADLGVRVAVRDNDSGFIKQYDGAGSLSEPLIVGYDAELAYSCDNDTIVYRYAVNWRNKDAYMGARDGSSQQIWSSSDLRDFDWICP
jgi:hypothetical protein